jgi:hypothetical protein
MPAAKRRTKSKCGGAKKRTKSKSKRSKSKSKSKRTRSKSKRSTYRGGGNLNCEPGQIERVGYTRSDGTYVEPSCVKDMGAPGKAAGTEAAILPPIEDTGFFTKHGFELYDKHKRDKAIKAAVKELVDDEGMTHDEAVTKVIQHIVLPMNYSKNQPHPHEAWQEALDYAQSLR